MDVRFAAEYVPASSWLRIDGLGATVWVHQVWMEGGFTARPALSGKSKMWAAMGHYGPLIVLEDLGGPWRLHRDTSLKAHVDWKIDPKNESRATLSIHYSHTRDGEVIEYLLPVTFPTVPQIF
jgi:hypothetical protein